MAASNLVAAGGAWECQPGWPMGGHAVNADTVSIHSNTSSARAVRIQQSYIKFHTVRHTEKRAVWAAIQTIHRTYLVPRPLYDHTAYTAILSHTAYTLYSPYTIQLTSPPLCVCSRNFSLRTSFYIAHVLILPQPRTVRRVVMTDF